jgi:hypothetical protein
MHLISCGIGLTGLMNPSIPSKRATALPASTVEPPVGFGAARCGIPLQARLEDNECGMSGRPWHSPEAVA